MCQSHEAIVKLRPIVGNLFLLMHSLQKKFNNFHSLAADKSGATRRFKTVSLYFQQNEFQWLHFKASSKMHQALQNYGSTSPDKQIKNGFFFFQTYMPILGKISLKLCIKKSIFLILLESCSNEIEIQLRIICGLDIEYKIHVIKTRGKGENSKTTSYDGVKAH